MSLRFTPDAARRLRDAIREAGGVEVFAIGDVERGTVVGVTVTCRGQADRVPALLDRPRTGQVVVHNHPSGDLTASDADLHLAGLYGDDGIGVVIVDSGVTRSNWVVEPHATRVAHVDPADVERFFREALPRSMPGSQVREGQIGMAHRVAASLSNDLPFVCEAGTGTGKSLGYLVPAALWALANDGKVVVSTFTRALQAQLLSSDLPLLSRAGLEVRAAVLQGRTNYVCKRRLGLAADEDAHLPPDRRADLDALVQWEASSATGARADLPFPVDPLLWERVESDSDLTLRLRCPHYQACRYYVARREAAAAHIIVVNHALLLADLSIRDQGGPGVLPRYHRLILDEAHHLEDAATGAASRRVGLRAIQRATAPLLSRKRRRGVLDRLRETATLNPPVLPPDRADELLPRAAEVEARATTARAAAEQALAELAHDVVPNDGTPLRLTAAYEETPEWDLVAPRVDALARRLDDVVDALAALAELFEDVKLPPARVQPLLDLSRARRRLATQAASARATLAHDQDVCRWIEARPLRRGGVFAELVHAPIEVAPTLRRILWDKIPGTASTSATMTVGGRFGHWMRRVGLDDADNDRFPSPFDYPNQALLGLPRDLPLPDDPAFLDATADVIADAVRMSDGGAFVLCTSYAAVRHYAGALRRWLPDRPVLAQGQVSRTALLARFRENPRSVLVGTDSFWEGVDVRGDALRLVVIPRLPFRVPTDPLHQARYERIAMRGGDPFRAYALPEAVIKLEQGFGRLIRSRTDRGVVLLLDRRLHERTYGRVMLHSLPPARRLVGPWRRVRDGVGAFFSELSRPGTRRG